MDADVSNGSPTPIQVVEGGNHGLYRAEETSVDPSRRADSWRFNMMNNQKDCDAVLVQLSAIRYRVITCVIGKKCTVVF